MFLETQGRYDGQVFMRILYHQILQSFTISSVVFKILMSAFTISFYVLLCLPCPHLITGTLYSCPHPNAWSVYSITPSFLYIWFLLTLFYYDIHAHLHYTSNEACQLRFFPVSSCPLHSRPTRPHQVSYNLPSTLWEKGLSSLVAFCGRCFLNFFQPILTLATMLSEQPPPLLSNKIYQLLLVRAVYIFQRFTSFWCASWRSCSCVLITYEAYIFRQSAHDAITPLQCS